jgi:hypothetical protein
MRSALERLREAQIEETRDTDPLLQKYPPDELGERCAACGSQEKWVWLDERRLCRPCLISGKREVAR